MNNSRQSSVNNIKKYINPKIGFIFIFLIILQFSLLPLISSNIASENGYSKYVDYSYLYVMISYTMIVLGVVIFQAQGFEILSDHFSVWVIVLSCFVRSGLRGSHELIYEYYLIFLGLILSVYVIKNHSRFRMPDSKTVIVGFLWASSTVFVISLTQALLSANNQTSILPSNLTLYIFSTFLFQVSFVTVIEEVCFRGLIVGFMIMNGYKENTAFLVQAVLFWGIHYMYTTSPVWFFVGIPLLTLSTTLIMKKYKMIFLSIMTHTFVNVFTYIFTIALKQYFL